MHMTSLPLLLTILAGSPPYGAPPVTEARAEARVSLRIVRGARIGWDMRERPEGARLSRVRFRAPEGTDHPARFIEFE